MVLIKDVKIGNIYTLKKNVSTKYGVHPDFIKKSKRPFVVAEITEFGSIWLVPSYSNCAEYCREVKDFYFLTSTPNGNTKFLDYRNMIAIEAEDINSEFKTSNNTIQEFESNDLKNFLAKYKQNKKMLRKEEIKARTYYKDPFNGELLIIKKYLKFPYAWLERDFNKVNNIINFSSIDEFKKSNYANVLYFNYIKNLQNFIKYRNLYIPLRKNECISYFDETKFEIMYKCLSEQGYVHSLNPIVYCDNHNDALLISINDIEKNFPDSIYEQVKIKMPLLNKKQELENASEIIWLDNNIVSKKTYYDVFGCEPSKQQKREIIEKYKQD